MDVSALIIMLAIGAVAGWLAGNLMAGGGFGLLGNIVVGIVGAVIGGFLFSFLGISAGGLIGSIITATVGAAVLLFVVGLIKK
ncbi:GlsB/YeaQ/YmgE family stress response membrane protein [Aestuariicella sp. G3-2]|uniref:GlsB/YeaQ/YmgE family stress response membrane protein n=1 Tax=Pseudomaricurvus albidus TaxID=2842452 RepID=UPI001C0BD748|nr:GlsB/YeaQ/YmgE family stress response membrane protein [Aestuariicella albida]MBU3070140.1 GlsB/YeaQ/YmgE family stress response membrane protein [Aestuariicella albida]